MTDCACDICEMKKYYTKVFNISTYQNYDTKKNFVKRTVIVKS